MRNGVADVFMVSEPPECRRHVRMSTTRTRADFAQTLKAISDEMYPHAEKVVLVMDNLNTHSTRSLYEASEPEEARRLSERFEIHYTPKHGSWLDMAEIEIGVLMRHGLPERAASTEEMENRVQAWELERNKSCGTVDWQFTTQDARVRLKSLYPKFDD